jgi:large subunit ribosomal protein L31e
MAKDKTKKTEPKLVLEREYTVPLRREWLKVGMHKRANRAVKTLKKFIARHMKIYDRDLRKIKLDVILNNELRFRGMRKPPAKIKVKAKKFDNETVKVELINLPEHVRFIRLREEKKKAKLEDKKPEESKEKIEEEKGEREKDKKIEESKEKEEASKDEGLKISKEQAKEQKHISKDKKVIIHRRALSR